MGIQVKAVERNISFEKGKEEFAYVMQTSNYNLLDADKVMQQAALITGLPKPILQASWYGIGGGHQDVGDGRSLRIVARLGKSALRSERG